MRSFVSGIWRREDQGTRKWEGEGSGNQDVKMLGSENQETGEGKIGEPGRGWDEDQEGGGGEAQGNSWGESKELGTSLKSYVD